MRQSQPCLLALCHRQPALLSYAMSIPSSCEVSANDGQPKSDEICYVNGFVQAQKVAFKLIINDAFFCPGQGFCDAKCLIVTIVITNMQWPLKVLLSIDQRNFREMNSP